MSAPVDVLAVMGIAATTLHAENYSGTANSMDAAHAAVAELIEAGDRLTAAFRALGESRDISTQVMRHRECESAMASFDAALARVKGGAE